jgi:hypothetical protein
MNRKSNRAASHRGDFISEDAVRGVLSRRRAADTPSPSERRAAPLRRWSVAELLARAAARPVDGMSH